MSTAEQRAWEREQKRLRDLAGEAEAARLNDQIVRRVDMLERLLNWSLDHAIRVDFQAMKVRAPVLQLSRSLTLPLAQPNARDFKPRPLNFLTKMAPKAEERFQARWEQGRVAYEKACAQWQQAEYEFPRARDIIPDEASFRYVKSKEIIEAKPRTAADKQKLYKSVLAQITLRVLYELLTADLHEHVQRIAFNGVVDDIDPSTGRPTRPKLVSLRVGRAEFLDRDFSLIEPQPALRSLKANFSPAPTELRAIPPILEFDVNDPRFIEEEEILSTLDERTNLIDLTPQAFETLIRDLFQAMGFDTYQTTPSRD